MKKSVPMVAALTAALVMLSLVACGGKAPAGTPAMSGGHEFVIVPPGTHPSLLFSKQELPKLRVRTGAPGLPGESWQRVESLARGDSTVRYEGEWSAHRLIAMALVYQVGADRQMGRAAVDYLKGVLREKEPFAFYKEVDSDFFDTEHWPRAFAYAWDWLYEVMDDTERGEVVAQLELWCKALYEHTEAWWWRDASYNCGAIPVGALGLLCTSIQAEATHPEFQNWFESCIRRIRDNFFPTSWRANGICYEGPCYAQYVKNPLQFGEALRRTGGEDIVKNSGAINAMHYQTFQWMPQEGCGPVGDNTDYGRRVFNAAYLMGMGEMRDGASLRTFETYTDRRRLDPVITFLWYPDGLNPVTPKQAAWPTSYYFEITPNRAGYVYSRSEWDNERAHYFVFATRYAGANHQHYDHNTFLFHAFGEEFGTHRNIYAYRDPDHGADKEHNIVIVDGGGWPANDRPTSAGDDCSTGGLLVGLGLGHLADYVRGDARESYRDNSVRGSCPALRADRTCVFVKQGPAPYLFVADDLRQSEGKHDYDWQWFTMEKVISGKGTSDQPFIISGRGADCGITIVEPSSPSGSFQVVESSGHGRNLQMGLLKVRLSGSRVRYVALAAAWEKGAARPAVRKGPKVEGNPTAVSLVVESPGFSDLLLWQPEEKPESPAPAVTCGDMSVQAYFAMVRCDNGGKVTGYVLGEGGKLAWRDTILVSAEGVVSVSADQAEVRVTGKLNSREGDAPVPAFASVLLPGPDAAVFADGARVDSAPAGPQGLVLVGSPSYN